MAIALYARKSVERENSVSCETQLEYCRSMLRPEEKSEELLTYVDNGFSETYQHSLDLWAKYDNKGYFQGTAMLKYMTEDETDIYNNSGTKISNFLVEEAPKFITGERDIWDDTDWNNWVTLLKKYNCLSPVL